ncbi:MAG TPA: magnesium transporter [Cyclobacteriaceae bacterium]|nr:magnesium transporter [Cyclobacteriaceae bacterium]
MTLKEFRTKILKRDFSDFSKLGRGKKMIDPAELAKVISSFDAGTALKTFESIPEKSQAKIFAYFDTGLQQQVIKGLSKEKGSAILNDLASDERFEFYASLKDAALSSFLMYLTEENRAETFNFLGYPQKSVARFINTDFASVKLDLTIGEVHELLRNTYQDTETVNVIYVVDDAGRLIDDIPIRRLVLNEPSKKLEEILDGFYVSLQITESREDAVAKFKEYDRVALPVVNSDNVLIGVVTIDDVLDIAEENTTKEMQKFGGVETLDFPYVKTPFFTLIKKRSGWLIILFVGEMLTATAMGYFDNEISKAVVLALFIPLIISSGGNSGSQAATLIIRAMALKEITMKDWWFVMRREILSGLTLGVVLGTIGFIRIVLWQEMGWFDYTEHYMLVAVTIFFSLIGIVMWGTLNGSMIPIFLKKFGFDPATSSAPFVATLVDVTGLIIYFSIAAVTLKGTLL